MKGGGLVLVGGAIAIAGAIGVAACGVLSINPHVREMMIAGIGVGLICALATLPVMLSRGASQGAVVQAGLISSTIHLLGSVIVATAAFARGVIATYPYLIWLAAFYAVTLVTLTIWITQQMRKAPVGANSGATNHA